ncbi:MAG: hypothetical protein H7287_07980 [Thermoleophilia bacterium]|nr:hypothetical protein [Thermoleophilia bacterium]
MTHVTHGTEAISATQITGDLTWFVEQCDSNLLRMDAYIHDAGAANDTELAEFFRRAQNASRRGSEQGKALMLSRS